MVDGIRQWLESLGLGEYTDAFSENHVDQVLYLFSFHTSSGTQSLGMELIILPCRQAIEQIYQSALRKRFVQKIARTLSDQVNCTLQ